MRHPQVIGTELSKPDPEPIAYITGWHGGYPTINVIDGTVLPNGTPLYAAPLERKLIGYLPAYAARIIHNEGSWDAFHLYRTQTDPTDIPVYL